MDAQKRIFADGILKVNSVDDDKNYRASLMLLNGKKNRNGWVYENIEQHLSQFGNIPVLCAWVDGKLDGHNFEIKKDETTGKEYPSFTGAESEHIIGWIADKLPNGETNVYMKNVDGTDWVCVQEALLPSFYNKEFIDELERNSGTLRVSIETLVTKCRVENNTEYEEEWSVIGVTVIGVREAVAGAKITTRKINAYGEELEKMRLRVAQCYANDIEPQTQKNKKSFKGVTRLMRVQELKDKFPNYTVLAVNGNNVALLDNKGVPHLSTAEKDGDEIICGKITEVSASAHFCGADEETSVDVPVETVIENYAKRNSELEEQLATEKKSREAAETALHAMQVAEKARRKNAVKAAVKARLEKLNANRPESAKFESSIADDILAKADKDAYTELVNASGEFIGDKQACNELDTLCMNKQMEMEAAAVAKANSAKSTKFVWEDGGEGQDSDDGNEMLKAIDNLAQATKN